MRLFGDVVEENDQWVKSMTCELNGHQWFEKADGWFDPLVKRECSQCGMRELYADY